MKEGAGGIRVESMRDPVGVKDDTKEGAERSGRERRWCVDSFTECDN